VISSNINDTVKMRYNQTDINEEKTPMDALQSITINPTELCNRTCHFCPRSDSKIYPNRNLHISEETVKRISSELKTNNYSNRVGWSGNGEPLLTDKIFDLIKIVSEENTQLKVHEIITNGDKLDYEIIQKLYDSGINHIIVSLYDGDEQLNKFINYFKNIESSKYTLRKSYYTAENNSFTNRGGSINYNINLLESHKNNKCYIPFYKLFLDYNGDVLICCEDWLRLSKNKLNINKNSLKEIWNSSFLNNYRKKLANGDRSLTVCNKCNINGKLIGKEFLEYYD